MGFRPLEEIEGPIILPFRGKEFTIPPLSFEDGVRLQAAATAKTLTDAELVRTLLGPVQEELHDAGASPALIGRVTAVAIAEWKYGRDAAEKAWEDPKALGDLMQRETAILQAMAAAASTPSPASGTTTSSPKTPVRRSRGKKSSPTGVSS